MSHDTPTPEDEWTDADFEQRYGRPSVTTRYPFADVAHWRLVYNCTTTDGREFRVRSRVVVSLQAFPGADRKLPSIAKEHLEVVADAFARRFAEREGVTIAKTDGEFEWIGNS